MKKKIGIFSKDAKRLLDSIKTPIKSFSEFTNLLDQKNAEFDLVIIESKKPFEDLKELKKRNLISEDVPCVVITDDLKKQPHLELSKLAHSGLVRIIRNSLLHYDELNETIQNALQPNMPVKVNKFLFVIPMFNEESRLSHVIDFLKVLLKIIQNQNIDARIRFVNDGSSDKSPEILSSVLPIIQKELNQIQVDQFIELVNLDQNTRKAGMYKAGLKNSEANYFFYLDSDNSFFEADIIKAISLIKDGYFDVIQATKDSTIQNRSSLRKLLSFCKRMCTYIFLPKGIYDSQTGFKLVNRNAAKHVLPHIKNEYGFAADLQFLNICKKMKFRALQLPVQCIEQEGSHVDPIADTKRYLSSLLKIATKKEVYHDYKL